MESQQSQQHIDVVRFVLADQYPKRSGFIPSFSTVFLSLLYHDLYCETNKTRFWRKAVDIWLSLYCWARNKDISRFQSDLGNSLWLIGALAYYGNNYLNCGHRRIAMDAHTGTCLWLPSYTSNTVRIQDIVQSDTDTPTFFDLKRQVLVNVRNLIVVLFKDRSRRSVATGQSSLQSFPRMLAFDVSRTQPISFVDKSNLSDFFQSLTAESIAIMNIHGLLTNLNHRLECVSELLEVAVDPACADVLSATDEPEDCSLLLK